MVADRRRFQRLRLAKPILGTMDGQNALILDVGLNGAFIEHHGTKTPGDRFRLSFKWQGEPIEFLCETARTEVIRGPVSHTGVRFVEPVGEAVERLQDMMATFIGRVLAAQKANASGDASDAAILAQIGEARRSRTQGFVSYRLRDGKWWRVPTKSPKQPADGFTVAAHEDPEEVETLCHAYERADEETRNMIRLVAELSTVSAAGR